MGEEMEIHIDEHAGFCFGVVKAIALAEQELTEADTLYCLGDIVHNNAEVSRLATMGLQVIDHQRFAQLHDIRVMIRAHGEPPETYTVARERNITLVDATCPIVLALQKKIRVGYELMRDCNGQVVIFGKKGHAEVVGLNGQTGGTALIVSSAEDADLIDPLRPIRLYSQTTKNKEEYQQLIEALRAKNCVDFVAYDTICNRVANRTIELEAFAKSVDLLIFVSGSNSSNGRYLYECCQKVLSNSHMVSDADELDACWFDGVRRVGITGATSTPRWLMERVRTEIATRFASRR